MRKHKTFYTAVAVFIMFCLSWVGFNALKIASVDNVITDVLKYLSAATLTGFVFLTLGVSIKRGFFKKIISVDELMIAAGFTKTINNEHLNEAQKALPYLHPTSLYEKTVNDKTILAFLDYHDNCNALVALTLPETLKVENKIIKREMSVAISPLDSITEKKIEETVQELFL